MKERKWEASKQELEFEKILKDNNVEILDIQEYQSKTYYQLKKYGTELHIEFPLTNRINVKGYANIVLRNIQMASKQRKEDVLKAAKVRRESMSKEKKNELIQIAKGYDTVNEFIADSSWEDWMEDVLAKTDYPTKDGEELLEVQSKIIDDYLKEIYKEAHEQ